MGFARLPVRTRLFVGFGLPAVPGAGPTGFTRMQPASIGTQFGRMRGLLTFHNDAETAARAAA